MEKSLIVPVFIPHAGCPFTCVFCNQWEISGESRMSKPEELETKVREYRLACKNDFLPLETAFYGGSFTGLEDSIQKKWLQSASDLKRKGLIAAIRLSTRPDYISEEILQRLLHYGVTTIELGVQSLSDEVLKKSRRGHTAADTIRATELIRRYPFSLVYQLMLGLPGDTLDTARQTARRAISARPDGVRIYPAVILQNTTLAKWYEEGLYQPWTLEQAVTVGSEWLAQFSCHGIRVIRMGLQDAENLRRGRDLLAGPYHPAYGELVQSHLMFRQINELIARVRRENPEGLRVLRISFPPRDYSRVTGQKRQNLHRWQELYAGVKIELNPDAALQEGDITVSAAGKSYSWPRKEFLEQYRIQDRES